jgi:hypothetical protein
LAHAFAFEKKDKEKTMYEGTTMVMQQLLTGKHLTAQSQNSRNAQDTINDDEGHERGQIDTFSS